MSVKGKCVIKLYRYIFNVQIKDDKSLSHICFFIFLHLISYLFRKHLRAQSRMAKKLKSIHLYSQFVSASLRIFIRPEIGIYVSDRVFEINLHLVAIRFPMY